MSAPFKVVLIRYVDATGRQVRKGEPGARPIREESTKWYGSYTDATGTRRRVALSSDHRAAKSILRELARNADLGQAGLIDDTTEHRKAPIDTHVDAYETHLAHKGVSKRHLVETIRRLRAVIDGCNARSLAAITVEAVEQYLTVLAVQGANPERKNAPKQKGASARTRNMYRSSVKAFTRWCHKSKRLREDILANLDPATGETRRQRRALTESELARLLSKARERPLADAMTVRTGKRSGERIANVRPEVRESLIRLGRERALMYWTMVLTGLRRGELASVECRHLQLHGSNLRLTLPGSATKNREEASIPLRADLARELSSWIADTGKTSRDKLFRVPTELVKILRRDLAAADIPYRDELGRTVDVHAMRHTTASHLSRGRVSPRVAQLFMRHSDIKLTMQTYTDPQLLNEAEALAALPTIPNDADSAMQRREAPLQARTTKRSRK